MSSAAPTEDHQFSGAFESFKASVVSAKGYDSHNGLHDYAYIPATTEKRSPTPEHFTVRSVKTAKSAESAKSWKAGEKKAPSPEAPRTAPVPTPIHQDQTIIYAHHGAQQPQYAYSYPQHYHYPHVQPHPSHMNFAYAMPQPPPPIHYTYVSAPAPAAPTVVAASEAKSNAKKVEKTKKSSDKAPVFNRHVYVPVKSDPNRGKKSSDVNLWLGRSKAQVEEDNMKIAMKEGVYEKRKVQPVGVGEHQYFWVVEADGSNSLRMFAEIKELKGEWQRDPRYVGAWFFLREKEK